VFDVGRLFPPTVQVDIGYKWDLLKGKIGKKQTAENEGTNNNPTT